TLSAQRHIQPLSPYTTLFRSLPRRPADDLVTDVEPPADDQAAGHRAQLVHGVRPAEGCGIHAENRPWNPAARTPDDRASAHRGHPGASCFGESGATLCGGVVGVVRAEADALSITGSEFGAECLGGAHW